ncbi:MAG: hypothetical protein JSU70_19805 [Phycisphaerales bacterium]|nr:MAG: hypothetical protein JSU70_19805 [Phycisphaerales bacterium]
MATDRHRYSGTVGGTTVVLLVFGLIVLCFVRYFWVDRANGQYGTLIRAYVRETPQYQEEDFDKLREQLLEGGMFIKMHRWDRKSFIKDQELYDKMVEAYKARQQRIRDQTDSTIDSLINL